MDKSEQETTVSFMRNDERAIIYTSDVTMITKLKKKVESNPEWKIEKEYFYNGEIVAYDFTCPKCLISFRSKTPSPRTISDEQREAFVRRIHGLRGSGENGE